jgi:hypothetical protein
MTTVTNLLPNDKIREEFFCGGTIILIVEEHRDAFFHELCVRLVGHDGAQEDPIPLSSHSHLRSLRRFVTEEGEIVVAKYRKRGVWVTYERFPAYCVCCHLYDYVLHKLGYVNIGPRGYSYRVDDNPIRVNVQTPMC